MTVFVSIAYRPIVPPFPEHCEFLSPKDQALVLAHVEADGGKAEDEMSFKKALHFLKN